MAGLIPLLSLRRVAMSCVNSYRPVLDLIPTAGKSEIFLVQHFFFSLCKMLNELEIQAYLTYLIEVNVNW